MTWFKHRCWFCGHESKELDFVEAGYQCQNREKCEERYELAATLIGGRFPYKLRKRVKKWEMINDLSSM